MEVQINSNIHEVEGYRTEEGIYTIPCPHAVAFEYINGWALRMVGSVTCTACSHNANHRRCMTVKGPLKVICMHIPGEEPNKRFRTVLNNVKV